MAKDHSYVFRGTPLGLGKGLWCVGNLCYVSDIIGVGAEEASRARVGSDWA